MYYSDLLLVINYICIFVLQNLNIHILICIYKYQYNIIYSDLLVINITIIS
jgi:hypothetical protein